MSWRASPGGGPGGSRTRCPTRYRTGKYRKPLLFVRTLEYSGKAFRKVVWKCDRQMWARLHASALCTGASASTMAGREARARAARRVPCRRREMSWDRGKSAVRTLRSIASLTRSRCRREAVTGRRPGRETSGPAPVTAPADRTGWALGSMYCRRLTIFLQIVDNSGA